MPVKPATTFQFALNSNYDTGPYIGFSTKQIPGDINNGFTPDTGIVSEWVNYLFATTGDWITDWISQGSNAADLDAHIVETNASGVASIGVLAVGGTASVTIPLSVTENSGYGAASASFDHGTGSAIVATSGGSVGTILGTNSGTGAGVTGVGAGTNNPGVSGQGIGTGAGVSGVGGATGPGVSGTGGATGGIGGEFTGTGVEAGVIGTGGSVAGPGVRGVAGNDSQRGIEGYSHPSSITGGAGVAGVVIGGSGVGGTFSSAAGTGYGLVAISQPNSPNKSSLRLEPQDDDPSAGADGDVMYNSTTDELRIHRNGTWMAPFAEENGYTRGFSLLGTGSNNASTVWTTIATVTLSAPYEPRHTGQVWIHASAEFGNAAGTIHSDFQVRIYNVTNTTPVYSQTLDYTNGVAGPIYDRPWSLMVPYNIPITGSITFELQFRRTGSGGTGIAARDASVFVHGVY